MKTEIDKINASIQQALREQQPATDIKAYGLAESVAIRGEDNITFPAIVLPDGECVDVYGETDKHHITFYHRLTDVSFQEQAAESFGSLRTYTETDELSLIVFGKRERISNFEMERIARKAISGLENSVLVASNFDCLQVFASEYAGVMFYLPPTYFVFKINYRITSTYNARCA